MVAWLKRYVAGDTTVDTGPRFEWLADDAQWRSAADYPSPTGRADHRHRQRHARRSTPPTPPPAPSPPPAAPPTPSTSPCRRAAAAQIVGEPQLTLTYRGTGAGDARLRPDRRRGARRRRRQPGHADPGDARRPAAHDRAARSRRSPPPRPRARRYTLQLIGGTPALRPGARRWRRSRSRTIELDAADGRRRARSAAAPACSRPTRTCLSRRRFTIRVRGAHPRVTVAGKRVKVRKGRAVVDLRGKPKGT